ncbi:MAG: ABC transporter ATP-binding protein, partial [Sporichthyaceae bacterium]|nr:ABC transporter ATP-binding protein [Sporichthyaceae bacterium]
MRDRQEFRFFVVLFRASPGLATAWWLLLLLRGAMPALLAVATGVLVASVRDGESLSAPLTFVGVVFVLFQVLTPLQQAVSANLGAVAGDWMNDRLMVATVSPPGMGHLESSELADDLGV